MGSCLGVGRPTRPNGSSRIFINGHLDVDPFGRTRPNVRSYLPNIAPTINGRPGPMPKLIRQTSALSGANQKSSQPIPPHSSPSQAVSKLVDIDDTTTTPNSQSVCNRSARQLATNAAAAADNESKLFLQVKNLNPNEYRVLLALYDYEPRTKDDLGFRKGDHLETSLSYMNGDWWLAQSKSTREVGYVPKNYVTDLNSIRVEPWFFGEISRSEAETLLRQPENKDGAFIIRTSESHGPSNYSLSVNHKGAVKHYKINQYSTGGFYLNPNSIFSTIQDLVEHHSKEPNGLCINLCEPCKVRNQPQTISLSHDTTDQWEIDRSRLTIGRELGRGQFGQVFEGLFEGKTRVAIKTLRKGSMDPQDFLVEAQIMKKMDHPNLVRLFAVCTREEPVYIITELMSRGALVNFLQTDQGRNLMLADYVKMANQIAAGMFFLEKESYVHRDLAARNILVGDRNVCKIADFGLARFIKETEYEAQVGARFPIKWTAPEAANFCKFTIKSDVWSFGIVLYEIITKGGTPYPDMTNAEVLSRIDKGYRMPQPPNCEAKYYNIMQECWNKDPKLRPTFETLNWKLNQYFCSDEQYKEASQFRRK